MVKEIGFGFADLGALGLLGLAIYGGVKLIQMSGIAKDLDMSIKELSKATPVDIQQAIVDQAVEKAVDREVHKTVQNISKRIESSATSDISREVKAEVKRQCGTISEKVTKKVADEVTAIKQEELFDKIVEKAEDLVSDKIEEERRKAAARLNKGLDSVLDIYDGISQRVAKAIPGANNSGQGLTFTVGR